MVGRAFAAMEPTLGPVVYSGDVPSTGRYFAIAFAFTWALQLPAVLARHGLLPGAAEAYLPLAVLGIFGPTVGAIWETRRERGRDGVRALLRRLSPRGVRGIDALAAVAAPGLLLSLGLALLHLLGREGPMAYPPDVPHLVSGIVISFAEEIGWRGYALPRLEARFGVVRGNGVLGALWALWHIPMLLAVGTGLEWMPLMLVYFAAGSLYFAFLNRRAGGSIFVAVLAHLGAHLNNSHAALPADATPFLVQIAVFVVLALSTVRATQALPAPAA